MFLVLTGIIFVMQNIPVVYTKAEESKYLPLDIIGRDKVKFVLLHAKVFDIKSNKILSKCFSASCIYE
jgi:hypothetical protein